MTIIKTNNQKIYTISDINILEYNFDFPINSAKDISITLASDANIIHNRRKLDFLVDYTVDYNLTNQIGKIIFNSAVKIYAEWILAASIIIKRSTIKTQEIVFEENTILTSRDVENALDKLTMICQDEKNKYQNMMWMDGGPGIVYVKDVKDRHVLRWSQDSTYITSAPVILHDIITDFWNKLLQNVTSLPQLLDILQTTRMSSPTVIEKRWNFTGRTTEFKKMIVDKIECKELGAFVNTSALNVETKILKANTVTSQTINGGTLDSNISGHKYIECYARSALFSDSKYYHADEVQMDLLKGDHLIFRECREPQSWRPKKLRALFGTAAKPSLEYKTALGSISGINIIHYDDGSYPVTSNKPLFQFITNNNINMECTWDGVVSYPKNSYMHATIEYHVDYATLGGHDDDPIRWTPVIDHQNEYDLTNRWFRVKNSGVYIVYVQLQMAPRVSEGTRANRNRNFLDLLINGGVFCSSEYNPMGEWCDLGAVLAPKWGIMTLNNTLYLDAGDTVQIRAYRDIYETSHDFWVLAWKGYDWPESGGTWPRDYTNIEYCWFDIVKIS